MRQYPSLCSPGGSGVSPTAGAPIYSSYALDVRPGVRGAAKTRTPGSAAVVEGDLVAVGVREREGAAERPVPLPPSPASSLRPTPTAAPISP